MSTTPLEGLEGPAAVEHGPGRVQCPYCENTYASAGGLYNHRKARHPETVPALQRAADAADAEPDAGLEGDPTLELPPSPTGEGEPETVPHKPGRVQRFRARFGRHGRTERVTSSERTPRAPRARVHRRRLPLDADISDVWGFVGRRLESTPHYPTARMLEYQAPAAGVILDRAVAGTLPDRVLFQPLARNRDKYEDVGFLLAGPLLTFSITTTMAQLQQAAEAGDEELRVQLYARLMTQRDAFAWVLQLMLPRLAAGAKLAAEKKAKRDAAIADAFPELGDADPVEALVNMLFVPPNYAPPTEEETAQNGKTDFSAAAAREQGSVQ